MDKNELSEVKINFYAGLFCIVLGIAVVIKAANFQLLGLTELGADFVPQLVGTLMAFLGAALTVQSAIKLRNEGASFFREKSEAGISGEARKRTVNVLLCCVLLLAYAFSISTLGFILASILYMFLQMLLLTPKRPSIKRIILFAAVSIASPYIISDLFFRLFRLILPSGLL